jgi:dihydrodipicolinate synthase/N-acetylneuraminate lyase
MDNQCVIQPAVTPLDAAGALDLPRLRTHIDRLLATGGHGDFVP